MSNQIRKALLIMVAVVPKIKFKQFFFFPFSFWYLSREISLREVFSEIAH
jgi:hypothetical protein